MSRVGGTLGTGRHARPRSMFISSKSNVMIGTYFFPIESTNQIDRMVTKGLGTWQHQNHFYVICHHSRSRGNSSSNSSTRRERCDGGEGLGGRLDFSDEAYFDGSSNTGTSPGRCATQNKGSATPSTPSAVNMSSDCTVDQMGNRNYFKTS